MPPRFTALATSIVPTACSFLKLPASPDATQRSAPSSSAFFNPVSIFRAPIAVRTGRTPFEVLNRRNGADSALTAKVTIILGNLTAPQVRSCGISILDVPLHRAADRGFDAGRLESQFARCARRIDEHLVLRHANAFHGNTRLASRH